MLLATIQGAANPQETFSTEQLMTWAERGHQLALEHGPRIVAALAILLVGWFLVRLVTSLEQRALARTKVEPTLASFVTKLSRVALMVLVAIAAISKLGVETASFVALLGAAGFAVGFALQGSLGNLAAGVMLMVFRPFRAGDFVEAGGTSGVVREVGIFATIFTTPDNKRVIVSNSSITGGNITNFSAMPTRRIDLVFGISYGDDMRKAKDILRRVMEAEPRVLTDPAPQIAVSELGDSSVNLVCRPWVATADYWPVRFALIEAAKQAFDAEGVTIPFPQRDVHLHQVA